ncbi:hypothetical protein BDQ12DRAFT_647377 [Crucibulum laeve]|uniref:RBR-type E3 ubiquitin transferase n=1 Tax=Crucibulum laeve TaxID=68775 RepID=A0A5C3MC33_9AGAR|nr:hypothetical protein BDQ12DRAFT_647377 [Crucibulum laeve]
MPVPTEDFPVIDDTTIKECQALQKEEYEVLESIYPECVSSQIIDGSLKLEIPIEFGEPRVVKILQDNAVASSSADTKPETISLSTLPPLLLQLILPPTYPLQSPPQILSIRATHMWLPKIAMVQSALLDQWQGEGVLYNWVEYIRTGEFLEPLSFIADGDTIQIPHTAPQLLVPLLTKYEESSKSTQFAQNSYLCSVCLTSLKGSKCLKLSCTHIFCRSCLEDFWGMCLEEGDVGRVGCPDPQCVKEGREANEEEVARVVSEAEVKRWRWLREKRSLEKDPTIIHCPMSFCQTPVHKPADCDDDSGWGRLRQCSACAFSFCAFCRRTWHGPITACPIAYSEKLVLEYLAADEGSFEQIALERRFGRTNIQTLVTKYQEEIANKEWLESSTMACPGCECHVEKNLGCNHMICWKCRQHFCYRCGGKLVAANPYIHFSTPGQPCYYKLFDFQAEDVGWQPVEGFNI